VFNDFSWSGMAAGFVDVLIGFTGPVPVSQATPEAMHDKIPASHFQSPHSAQR